MREKDDLTLKAGEARAAGDLARARGLSARAAEIATALLADVDRHERAAYSELAASAVGLWADAGQRERAEVLALNLLSARSRLTEAAARELEALLAGTAPAPGSRAAAGPPGRRMSPGTANRALSRPRSGGLETGSDQAAAGARGASRRSRRRA